MEWVTIPRETKPSEVPDGCHSFGRRLREPIGIRRLNSTGANDPGRHSALGELGDRHTRSLPRNGCSSGTRRAQHLGSLRVCPTYQVSAAPAERQRGRRLLQTVVGRQRSDALDHDSLRMSCKSLEISRIRR
jgi:hypothetical protein